MTNDRIAGAGPITAWTTDRRRRSRFEMLALPHLDAAYSLARWLTRNDADASDVVQESFLRAFRYFDTYRDGDAKSWVLKIVRHTCYGWLARNRPADTTSLDADLESGGQVATVSIHPATQLESRSDLRYLNELIEALPAPWRETIVLRELHELGYREIAEVTGVAIGTVMSRLHRARSQLLHAFAGEAPSGNPGRPEEHGESSVPKSSSSVLVNCMQRDVELHGRG